MCSDDDFTMTECDAYGKHVFKSQSWNPAQNVNKYETITTTDSVYDTVNIPAGHESGYEAITKTDSRYVAITSTDTGYEAITRI